MGLINDVVPVDALDEAVAALTSKIAAQSATVVGMGKAAFYRQIELGLEDAYAHTSAVMVENMMKADAAEGIDAFLEKRPPVWQEA